MRQPFAFDGLNGVILVAEDLASSATVGRSDGLRLRHIVQIVSTGLDSGTVKVEGLPVQSPTWVEIDDAATEGELILIRPKTNGFFTDYRLTVNGAGGAASPRAVIAWCPEA